MIVREFYMTREDGVNLYKTYSDENLIIHKLFTDETYDVAIDVEDTDYEYEETPEYIDSSHVFTGEEFMKMVEEIL